MGRGTLTLKIEARRRTRKNKHDFVLKNITDSDRITLKLTGKDIHGTHVMTITLKVDKEKQEILYKLDVPKDWKGWINKYIISDMVARKLTGEEVDDKELRRLFW